MTSHIPLFVLGDDGSESITLHGRLPAEAGETYQVVVECDAGASNGDEATFKQGTLLAWALAG